jgi:hypothetical protein
MPDMSKTIEKLRASDTALFDVMVLADETSPLIQNILAVVTKDGTLPSFIDHSNIVGFLRLIERLASRAADMFEATPCQPKKETVL